MKMNEVKEFCEALAGVLMIAGLVALYCCATPNQMSAEADLIREEAAAMEGGAE